MGIDIGGLWNSFVANVVSPGLTLVNSDGSILAYFQGSARSFVQWHIRVTGRWFLCREMHKTSGPVCPLRFALKT